MAAVRTNYHQNSLIQRVPQLSWSSVVLQEMLAWGTGRAESSVKIKQQPSNNSEAKELQYPQPTLTADSSIRPPAELSFHLTLQGLQRSPVSCHFVPPAYTASPFHPHTLALPPPSLRFIFYKGKNKPGVWSLEHRHEVDDLCEIILHSRASFRDLYL